MKTLAYFASGSIRDEYHGLNYDRIYLIDRSFSNGLDKVARHGKIICVGMDCLESIQYLKNEHVKIDCFVSLNEGLFEGGGSYPIQSDMFLGYAMSLFNDEYIHIVNKSYYCGQHRITMDLPYEKKELYVNDKEYINPGVFTSGDFSTAKVYKMRKLPDSKLEFKINTSISISIIHDSIWNYYDELGCIVLSFSEEWQKEFFIKIPKVFIFSTNAIDSILSYSDKNKIQKIGFIPFGKGKYAEFVTKLQTFEFDSPKKLVMFHLNKNDYLEIKKVHSNFIN